MKKTGFAFIVLLSAGLCAAGEGEVTVSAGYPGGNVRVVENAPGRVTVDNELRDTPRDWFYWNCEVTCKTAGTVRFTFPPKKGRLSAQGPAVSTDGGRTWSWLGRAKSHFYDRDDPSDWFEWTFAKKGEKVRFAQGIPYQKADLDRFLAAKKGNAELKLKTLAKTRKGTGVPLLVIGHGPDNVLMTARHHACEASASYVLEGILDEILSGSVFGRAFCGRYTLFCVPMVDLDGVLAGDQGKGRAPHDHNRDYAVATNLYPEVKAIIDLDEEKKFRLALDFHSPALRNDVHEAFYLTGVKTPELMANSNELIAWALEEFPDLRLLNHAFTASPDGFRDGKPFSVYFGFRPHVVYATTLEVAYASGNNPRYDADYGRCFGRAFLRALVRTDFEKSATPRTGCARLGQIDKSIPARTDQFYAAVEKTLADPALTPTEKAVARLRLARTCLRYRKRTESLAASEAVLAEPWATGRQRGAAFAFKAEALCGDEKTEASALAALEKDFNAAASGLSPAARFDFCEAYSSRAERLGDRASARRWEERQLKDAAGVQVFRIRNRLTALDLAEGKKKDAVERARETAALAKKAIEPMPIGVFGPLIVLEYVRALGFLPDTTPERIRAAAELGLRHPHCQAHVRAELEKFLK